MEAFDDDASGWVTIKEVNTFTDQIPKGWKLIQHLAYRSTGFTVECQKWYRKIAIVIHELFHITTKLLPQNVKQHLYYLDNPQFGQIVDLIIPLAKTGLPGLSDRMLKDVELDKLIQRRMSEETERWTKIMKEQKYSFDLNTAGGVLKAAIGQRIEWVRFVLLISLHRHKHSWELFG